jgi:hypothetical protein
MLSKLGAHRSSRNEVGAMNTPGTIQPEYCPALTPSADIVSARDDGPEWAALMDLCFPAPAAAANRTNLAA